MKPCVEGEVRSSINSETGDYGAVSGLSRGALCLFGCGLRTCTGAALSPYSDLLSSLSSILIAEALCQLCCSQAERIRDESSGSTSIPSLLLAALTGVAEEEEAAECRSGSLAGGLSG